MATAYLETVRSASELQEAYVKSLYFLISLLVPCVTFADAPRELSAPDPDRWWFEVAPYVWATSMKTDAEIGPVEAESEFDFGDIFQNLSGALMLHGEAHKGPWTIFGDVNYAHLESDRSFGPMNGSEIDVEVKQTILEIGGGYGFGKEKLRFDVLFGGRGLFLNADVDITAGQGGASVDQESCFFGPLVGGRLTYHFTSRWWASLRGDASGFGLDDAWIYSATGLVGYRFTEMISMAFGYKYMQSNTDSGNLDLDLKYHGPIVGVGFRF